jgi:hypothetical protein
MSFQKLQPSDLQYKEDFDVQYTPGMPSHYNLFSGFEAQANEEEINRLSAEINDAGYELQQLNGQSPCPTNVSKDWDKANSMSPSIGWTLPDMHNGRSPSNDWTLPDFNNGMSPINDWTLPDLNNEMSPSNDWTLPYLTNGLRLSPSNLPNMDQDGWSFNPNAIRPESCPPIFSEFSFPSAGPKNVRSFKPIMCSLCPKTFSRKYGLESHMAIHSDARPHKCQTCPDTFKRSSDLKRHAKTCLAKARRGSVY